MSEISPVRPGNGGLRASHADRDAVAGQLRAAAGDGRLTAGELDERLGAALSARTCAELAALTADLPADGQPAAASQPGLPASAGPGEVSAISCRHGRASRQGSWVVPASLRATVISARVTLDLTEAIISCPVLPIEADVRGGRLILIVRPGITVDAGDITLAGGNIRFRRGASSSVPPRLRVQLSGRVKGGNVEVRLPRRGFWQWLTRQPRPDVSPLA